MNNKKIDLPINELYTYARWYTNLKESTNDSFFDLYNNKSRYLVLMGGGGSGKSIFAGRKLLERISSEEGHRCLVTRKVARTLKESCFSQLNSQIYKYYKPNDFTINKTDMSITHKNGSKIIFAGLDDVEKLKSIYEITLIWIEEASEVSESDFNQLDIRMRGNSNYYKQMIITFNPIDINHWLKRRFFDQSNPDARTHKSTYIDNKFLSKEDSKVLENFKTIDKYYYNVYCLGNWGVLGKSVFNNEAIGVRIEFLNKVNCNDGEPTLYDFTFNETQNTLTNIHLKQNVNGAIKIFKAPQARCTYVIGADTAGEGSDFFVAQVLDSETGEQVATLRQQYDEDIFTRQLYCLGKHYNTAKLIIEANFSIFPIKELTRFKYYNQYVRVKLDTYTFKKEKSFGFRTTALTRPVIISSLIEIMRENIHLINDITTLEEMLTFVRNEQGRIEASLGAKDDCVMALALAYYGRM